MKTELEIRKEVLQEVARVLRCSYACDTGNNLCGALGSDIRLGWDRVIRELTYAFGDDFSEITINHHE